MFNLYFHSVYSDTNDDISMPDITEQLIISLSTIKFTEYDVINEINNWTLDRGTSQNNTPLLILHNYATTIAQSLAVLFNRSL